MNKLSSMKYSGNGSIREHIMEMRDIAAQLTALEVTISDSFLVHFILNSLPSEYVQFQISYNTHRDKWSINELLTMCVQEEGRLIQEKQNAVNFISQKRQIKRVKNGKGKNDSERKNKEAPSDSQGQSSNWTPKCFFCKKNGDIKKDCQKYQKWLQNMGISESEKTQ
ncbi:uncharacterized protein LOC109721903 [Ananas comosus]|uniref:Uncharacterized protein LOC109721903 n=1 Tax=Ananas comosus TaxID=4615 RepID=A0A6P5GAU4_ANACO|nr:uncharacterized protein LOC109721903 [Ananas comosus]